MLKQGIISKPLNEFITNLQKKTPKDPQKSIDMFCNELEKIIINAIKQTQIVIPPLTINVQGNAIAQTNAKPIVLKNALK